MGACRFSVAVVITHHKLGGYDCTSVLSPVPRPDFQDPGEGRATCPLAQGALPPSVWS